jgi:plastocyanin
MEEPATPPANQDFVPTPVVSRHSGPPRRGRLAAGVVLLLIVLLAVVSLANHHKSPKPATATTVTTPAVQLAHVQLTATGFVPATITIPKGVTLDWQVSDTASHIIASDPFPQDNSLPALKSHQLTQGASYHYRFTSPGTYSYHDDLHPTLNGVVVVK